MIRKGFSFSVLFAAFFFFQAAAQTTSSTTSLKLLPTPKELRLGEGVFDLTSRTRILVDANHATEDRTGAQTLAEEIEQQSGMKVPIESSRRLPEGTGTIVLARLSDSGVRSFLAGKG